jgi:hypothetical protein
VAEDEANVELLIETTRPVALVAPQTADEADELDATVPEAALQAYAPITTLRDPPYELSGYVVGPIPATLQFKKDEWLVDTRTPLAIVDPVVMVLMLVMMIKTAGAIEFKLEVNAPT